MKETLRVDTALVTAAGNKLAGIAGELPSAPAVTKPSGSDALSAAIAEKMPTVVDPVVEKLPQVKQALTKYADNVKSAASKYETTDDQIAQAVRQTVGLFDDPSGQGAGPPAAAGGGGGSPAGGGGGDKKSAGKQQRGANSDGQGTPGSTPDSTGANPAAVAGSDQSGMGQMGQMGQMMQMAQQAAQVPSQMMGALGQIPQTVFQGVQGIVETANQRADKSGEGQDKQAEDQQNNPAAQKSDGTPTGQPKPEHAPAAQHPAQAAGPTQGSGGERAPVTPSAPRHARPEPSPEISL